MTRLPMYDGCQSVERPCKVTTCRYHLEGDAPTGGDRPSRVTGELHKRKLDQRIADGVTDTCALDVASCGAQRQETVAMLLGVTHQAIDLIEQKAMRKLANMPPSKRRILLQAWGGR